MVSDSFRHELRHEAELWQADGLIDAGQYQQLAERYQFNTLDTVARDRFVSILLGLGSILIGLGIITFVAANWQEIPRIIKVTLLLSLFIGVNIAGFYLWRRSPSTQHRLGQGLLLLGALILGANMALMGQMFHINAPVYELLLAWGIGVIAMAYSLRSTPLGILAIILIGSGYWSFWGTVIYQSWLLSLQELSWSTLIGQHMPLIASLLFVPLAYWCRSAVIFALAATIVVLALVANLQFFPATDWLLAIAFVLPPALLWGYDDSWWVYGELPWQSRRSSQLSVAVESFQPLAQSLALVYLGVLFYLLSFQGFWQSIAQTNNFTQPQEFNWLPLLDILILSSLALFEWWQLLGKMQHSQPRENLVTVAIGIWLAIAAVVTCWHTIITPISWIATAIFNLLLFLLAAGIIRAGLAQGERRAFWGGIVLLTLRVLSWFLLSPTGLLFKSLMFILCGVGLIFVGLWFERRVRTLNQPANSRSNI